MGFQHRLQNFAVMRQQALVRQAQQKQRIVGFWRPIVSDLLRAAGETMWGPNKFSVVEPRQSAAWTLVNFTGTRNRQYYIIMDFAPVDIDEALASGRPLPHQLTVPVGFRVIGAEEYRVGIDQTAVERALAMAIHKGPNVDTLSPEIIDALSRLPYQVDEYDRRPLWQDIPMRLAGPATVVLGLVGAYFFVYYLVGGVAPCMGLSSAAASGAMDCHALGNNVLGYALLFLICGIGSIAMLVGGVWGHRATSGGRRMQRLPPRVKLLAALALFPGAAAVATVIIGVVFVAAAALFGSSSNARESEVRSAVRDELREHGL